MQRVPSPSPYAPVIGFSAAVRTGELVLVSGTTAADASGAVVGEGDPAAQTREVLRKIGLALEQAGAALSQVVQTRVYLTRAQDWEAVGHVHGEVLADALPAATMVVVAGLLDPRMLVEIEAVAFVG